MRPEWAKGVRYKRERASGRVNALRGGKNLDSVHWARNTECEGESNMKNQERWAGRTTKELFLTFIYEIVLLMWEGGTWIRNPFLKEMGLLHGLLSGTLEGGWGRMDTLHITSHYWLALSSTPARFLKIHVAKSCGYSDFHPAKATVWKRKGWEAQMQKSAIVLRWCVWWCGLSMSLHCMLSSVLFYWL